MEKRIFFYPERCLLCKSCVLACEMRSLRLRHPLEIRENQRPLLRMSVSVSGGVARMQQCRHCLAAPCVEACISGSLIRSDEEGRVVHRENRCELCGACHFVCPHGGVFMDEEAGKISKCDLCADEPFPACVEACPNGALVFGEPEDLARIKRKIYAESGLSTRRGF